MNIMSLTNTVLLVSAMLLVGACSKNEEVKPTGVIPEAQLQAMEKARAVEEELKKQHKELRKKLDEE